MEIGRGEYSWCSVAELRAALRIESGGKKRVEKTCGHPSFSSLLLIFLKKLHSEICS